MKYKLDDKVLTVVSGEWPTNNIDAIKECIKKFEVIKAYLKRGKSVCDTGEAFTCALCHIYFPFYNGSHEIESCSPCPIKNKTGLDGCGGTPYEKLRPQDNSFKIEDVDREIKFIKEVLKEELRKELIKNRF